MPTSQQKKEEVSSASALEPAMGNVSFVYFGYVRACFWRHPIPLPLSCRLHPPQLPMHRTPNRMNFTIPDVDFNNATFPVLQSIIQAEYNIKIEDQVFMLNEAIIDNRKTLVRRFRHSLTFPLL